MNIDKNRRNKFFIPEILKRKIIPKDIKII